MSERRLGPSPAMVVACVALSVALAGSAIAGTEAMKGALTKKQVKKIATKQADKQITARAAGLSVGHADTAGSADTAKSADTAQSAAIAGSATSATTAETATNVAESEPFHLVGTPGEPPFENGCSQRHTGTAIQDFAPVGFYKDKLGVVHLQGVMNCPATGSPGFTLPAGYRPGQGRVLAFSVSCFVCSGGTVPFLNIAGPGTSFPGGVMPVGNGGTPLDGITFRAEG